MNQAVYIKLAMGEELPLCFYACSDATNTADLH
jgi:hypothetical protein